ncbi:MAG: hypothetical protein FJ011_00580 [Chloroflexi bacterium]|nr:hypothetical protein [Chloroflexota bacterium]
MGELLAQGLMIAILGMGLVFAALGLLWGLLALLMRLGGSPAGRAARQDSQLEAASALHAPQAAQSDARQLTDERARVAAIAAAALMSNAVSLGLSAPAGPTFQHGRTAPAWVSTNRVRALQAWQPPRSEA